MAALTVNERAVKLVRVDESIAPARSAQAVNAGQVVSANAAGEYAPGGAEGLCLTTVLEGKAAVSVLKKGIVELGEGVQALDFGASVFAAADGSLDDATGTAIGTVIPGYGHEPPKKLVRVDL